MLWHSDIYVFVYTRFSNCLMYSRANWTPTRTYDARKQATRTTTSCPKSTQSTNKTQETKKYLEERRNKDAYQKRITNKDGNLEHGRPRSAQAEHTRGQRRVDAYKVRDKACPTDLLLTYPHTLHTPSLLSVATSWGAHGCPSNFVYV